MREEDSDDLNMAIENEQDDRDIIISLQQAILGEGVAPVNITMTDVSYMRI